MNRTEKEKSKQGQIDYHKIAQDFLAKSGRILRYHQGNYLEYKDTHYQRCEPEFLTLALRRWMNGNKIRHNNMVVGNLAESVKAIVAVESRPLPFYLGQMPFPGDVIAFKNGLLDLQSVLEGEPRLLPHTPNWISTSCLPYDYDPESTSPTWNGFLNSSLEGDAAKIRLLQQWFGYCLTQDTNMHKMMFLVGSPRAGKGTTSRVLQQLVGEENHTAYSLWKLATSFGIAPLVGKQVAFVGEVNLAGVKEKARLLETLNSIVGGDPQCVNPKHKAEYTVFLPTRFMFNCNSMPRFPDNEGALASRLLIVQFPTSFVGREDRALEQKLKAELTGIANWALAGLVDLRREGSFTMTEDLREIIELIQRDQSPVLAFAQDRLVVATDFANPALPGVPTVNDDLWATKADIRQAYQSWCQAGGADSQATEGWFFRDLFNLFPKLKNSRERKNIDGKNLSIVRGIALAPRLP